MRRCFFLNPHIPHPRTSFLRVKCANCGNEQIMFSAPSTRVKCLACETILASPSASKAKLKASVSKELR